MLANACQFLVRKPEKKKHLGKPTCRGQYNIKIDLNELTWALDSLGSVLGPITGRKHSAEHKQASGKFV
jgi:hypothetical protein